MDTRLSEASASAYREGLSRAEDRATADCRSRSPRACPLVWPRLQAVVDAPQERKEVPLILRNSANECNEVNVQPTAHPTPFPERADERLASHVHR